MIKFELCPCGATDPFEKLYFKGLIFFVCSLCDERVCKCKNIFGIEKKINIENLEPFVEKHSLLDTVFMDKDTEQLVALNYSVKNLIVHAVSPFQIPDDLGMFEIYRTPGQIKKKLNVKGYGIKDTYIWQSPWRPLDEAEHEEYIVDKINVKYHRLCLNQICKTILCGKFQIGLRRLPYGLLK